VKHSNPPGFVVGAAEGQPDSELRGQRPETGNVGLFRNH